MSNLLFPSAASLISGVTGEGPTSQKVDVSFASFKRHEETVSSSTSKDLNSIKSNSSNDSDSSWIGEEESESQWTKKEKKRKKKRKKKHKKKEKQKYNHKKKKFDKPKTIWLENTTLDINEAYRKDRQPDVDNLEFQGLYKMDIAVFQSCNICLGLNGYQKQMYFKEGKRKKKRNNADCLRYFAHHEKVHSENDAVSDKEEFQHDIETANYIPIKSSFNKSSLEIMALSESESETSKVFGNKYYTDLNKIYTKELLDDPHDIETWIKFVKHQDEHYIFALGSTKDIELKKAITEKKLSVLDKAINKNPTSVELMIMQMNLVNEYWSPENVSDKWKKLLFQFPNKTDLWMTYLLQLQTDLLQMKVSNVLESYRKCFQMLIGIIEGNVKSHQKEESATDKLFLLFLQLVIFLWKAGHTEKVICMFEALIEFNLYQPKCLPKDMPLAKRKEEFEKFFDSPVVRFGTVGARGWYHSVEGEESANSAIIVEPISYNPREDLDFEAKLNLHQSKETATNSAVWSELETVRSFIEFTPYLGNSEECEDTERIILFDDISFTLFDLSNGTLHFQLILSYLFLLGLPIEENLLSHHIINLFSKHYVILADVACTPCYCHHSFIGNTHVQIDSLLYVENKHLNPYAVDKIRAILSQSLSKLTSKYQKYLSLVWFHFESIYFRKSFENVTNEFDKKYWKEHRKFVKRLLKLEANQKNIPLWVLYAKHEWNVGNQNESEKVFLTVLKLICEASDDKDLSSTMDVIKAIVECQLHADKNHLKQFSSVEKYYILNTFEVMINAAELRELKKGKPCATMLLRISAMLKNEFHAVIANSSKPGNSSPSNFLFCYVVFEYLFNSIDSVFELYKEVKDFYGKHNGERNGLSDVFICILQFMQLEASCNYRCFAVYKEILKDVLTFYPEKQIFNQWFVLLNLNGLNSLEARKYYANTCKESETIHSWLNYLTYEKSRLDHVEAHTERNTNYNIAVAESECGIHYRIKHLYERVLEQEKYQYCTGVWLEYIKFQLEYGSRKEAVDIFNRALRRCCGSKDMCTLACSKLDIFDDVYSFMCEKEIRIKLLLEELDILLGK